MTRSIPTVRCAKCGRAVERTTQSRFEADDCWIIKVECHGAKQEMKLYSHFVEGLGVNFEIVDAVAFATKEIGK